MNKIQRKQTNWRTMLAMTGITIAAILAILISSASVIPAAFANVSGSTDTSCNNSGGNLPGGQQPSCQGSGLTQNSCSATTGNGNCPKGQNK